MSSIKPYVKSFLFGSKWLLIPFYAGLVIAQVFYCIKFIVEMIHLSGGFLAMNENELMLAILSLIDITMIANLIKMIITSSYQTFVEKTEDDGIKQERISSSYLKVKIGSALIGVSSIHLLKVFIESAELSDRDVIIKSVIHIIFILSTMGLSYISHQHHKEEAAEHS